MTIANNTVVAKIFAALAVAGLVVSSVAAFAPVAGAQTTTTTTTTTSASVSFSRDLTIGSTGADVTALQNWLISKGHVIAAGATGYFGAQTQAALAAYQAANGISPAAGYFGPITRAAVGMGGGSTGGTGTGTGTGTGSTGGDLSGGEADISEADLIREESTGDEGEEEVSVFTVEFDVEDGDVRVERMEITASSTDDDLSNNPWDYFDRVSIWVDGDEVADMDTDSRSDWNEEDGEGDDQYVLNLTGLDIVVEEGDQAEITVAFDIAGSIDSEDLEQEFVFSIDTDGIRAVDAEGIQQYTDSGSDTVTFGFGEEENGDLSVQSSDEDPDAAILVSDEDDESEDYTVFAFEIENDDSADALITELMIDVDDIVTTPSGGDVEDVIRRATLVVDGDEYDGDLSGTGGSNDGTITFEDMDLEIAGDDTLTFELMVTLVRNATSTPIQFFVSAADVEAEGLDSGDDADVSGSANSATHSIASTGVSVEAVSTSQSVTTPGDDAADTYGTYTIKFDVTALDEDAYIQDAAASTTAAGNGVTFALFGDTYAGPAASAALTSTADRGSGNDRFVVREGDTETFTLTVTLNPTTAGTFGVRLNEVLFNEDDANYDTTFTVDSGNEDFRTDAIYIAQ